MLWNFKPFEIALQKSLIKQLVWNNDIPLQKFKGASLE